MPVSVFCFCSCACLCRIRRPANSHDSAGSLFNFLSFLNFSHGLMTTLTISWFFGKNHIISLWALSFLVSYIIAQLFGQILVNITSTNLCRILPPGRVVLGFKKFDHISQAIKSLNWLPVNDRTYLNDAVMMYKCINKLVHNYLFEKFTLRDQLNIPRCRLTTGQRSFTYRSAKLHVKSSDSVKVFRQKIVNLLFSDQSMNL